MHQFIPIILTGLFSSALANAQSFAIDPKVGVEVSMTSVQSLMATSPLPRLDGGKSNEVPVGINYLTGRSERNDPMTVGAVDEAEFKGFSYSIGFIGRENRGLRYFIWFMGNSASGSLEAVGGGLNEKISDINISALATTVGVGKRLFGGSKKFLSGGVFGGLTYTRFQSTFLVPSGGGNDIKLEFNPNMYGVTYGAQLNLYFWQILVNPYFLSFYELSERCKTIDGTSGACTELPGDFGAFGVNLAYKGLMFNVMSKVIASETEAEVEAHNYGVSYTFGFQW